MPNLAWSMGVVRDVHIGGTGVAPSDDALLAEIVRRVATALDADRVYLFGSRARGEVTSDSDYDLLVLVKGRTGDGYEMERRAYRALGGIEASVDVVVMTTERYERRRGLRASLPGTVAREGRLLFAA